MTRKSISFGDMLLFLLIGFSFVRAAGSFSILWRASDFEPSFETISPGYFKCVTVSSFFPLIFIFYLNAASVVCHLYGPFCTYLHLISYAGFVETFS